MAGEGLSWESDTQALVLDARSVTRMRPSLS